MSAQLSAYAVHDGNAKKRFSAEPVQINSLFTACLKHIPYRLLRCIHGHDRLRHPCFVAVHTPGIADKRRKNGIAFDALSDEMRMHHAEQALKKRAFILILRHVEIPAHQPSQVIFIRNPSLWQIRRKKPVHFTRLLSQGVEQNMPSIHIKFQRILRQFVTNIRFQFLGRQEFLQSPDGAEYFLHSSLTPSQAVMAASGSILHSSR